MDIVLIKNIALITLVSVLGMMTFILANRRDRLKVFQNDNQEVFVEVEREKLIGFFAAMSGVGVVLIAITGFDVGWFIFVEFIALIGYMYLVSIKLVTQHDMLRKYAKKRARQIKLNEQ